MFIYLIGFILTIIFMYICKYDFTRYKYYKNCYIENPIKLNLRKKRIYQTRYLFWFLLACMPLGLIAALRYNVGTDYLYTYIPNFKQIIKGNYDVYSEWGFIYINKFLALFTSNPQAIIFFTGFIFIFFVNHIVLRYSENILMSFVILLISTVFFISLNNVRQSIAAMIFVFAFPYAMKRNFIKYSICMAIALLFHMTAIPIFFMYFLINSKFMRKHFLFIAFLIICFLPLLAKVLVLILENTKYNYYFISDFNNGSTTSINIIYGLFYFIVFYVVLRDEIKTNKISYTFVLFQFFYFLISFSSIFISVSEMISRMCYYFLFYQIISIPYVISKGKTKRDRILITLLFVITYCAYTYYFIILRGYHDVLPYHMI